MTHGGIRVTDIFETKVQKLKGEVFSISNQNYEDLSFFLPQYEDHSLATEVTDRIRILSIGRLDLFVKFCPVFQITVVDSRENGTFLPRYIYVA